MVSKTICSVSKQSVTCRRGRRKVVSLICLIYSENKSEQIGSKPSKSEQIGVFPKTRDANRNKTGKSEQIGTNRADPLLPTPNRGLRTNAKMKILTRAGKSPCNFPNSYRVHCPKLQRMAKGEVTKGGGLKSPEKT